MDNSCNIPPDNPMWEYMTVNSTTMKLINMLAEAGVGSSFWNEVRSKETDADWKHMLWIGKTAGIFPRDTE
jgi:hypothetical protein